MFEIEAVAPTPLPRVVQVEHGHHVAFAHLHEQIVESGQNGVVIDAGFLLQGRLDLGLDATLAVAAHQDAQVVDAHALHLVEFAGQTGTVAALSFRCQDGTIPEVSTDIIIWFTCAHEMSVFDTHEVLFASLFLLATHDGRRHC